MACVRRIVHVTFIKSEGRLIPWHVVLTDTEPPFQCHTVGFHAMYCPFTYLDTIHNASVDNFPRGDLIHFDELVRDMTAYLKIYHEQLTLTEGRFIMGAVDLPTYIYLKNIFVDVVLLDPDHSTLIGEYLTTGFAHAMYVHRHAESTNSE